MNYYSHLNKCYKWEKNKISKNKLYLSILNENEMLYAYYTIFLLYIIFESPCLTQLNI